MVYPKTIIKAADALPVKSLGGSAVLEAEGLKLICQNFELNNCGVDGNFCFR